VANAVLDGADCVMLSGETAKGSYPMESGELCSDILRRPLSPHNLVLMMSETCLLAEAATCYPVLYDELRSQTSHPTETTETVAIAAVAAASEQNASAIVVLTTSGNTARLISKFRPTCPIIVGKSFFPSCSVPCLTLFQSPATSRLPGNCTCTVAATPSTTRSLAASRATSGRPT
jgi:pyruvate kinase